MPTPSVEQVRGWLGRVMVDRDGNRLGEITDIYLDRETDRSEWAVVRTGLFGLRSSFVPLAEASEVDDQIQVPHARTLVKDAPNIEAEGQLSEAEEAELYRHYGLDYDTVTADRGLATATRGRVSLVAQQTRTSRPCQRPPTSRPLPRPGGRPSGAATTRSCKRLTPWGRPSRPPTRGWGSGRG